MPCEDGPTTQHFAPLSVPRSSFLALSSPSSLLPPLRDYLTYTSPHPLLFYKLYSAVSYLKIISYYDSFQISLQSIILKALLKLEQQYVCPDE